MFPEQNESQQSQQEQDEKNAQRRYEFEKINQFRREEYHNFPERNYPNEVRHEASKVREFWLDQWFRRGVTPYDFIVEQSIIMPGRYRIEQLRDSLPSGLYNPSREEKAAKLVEGKFQEAISDEFLQTDGLRFVEKEDGKRVWEINGEERYQFKDNSLELKIYQDMGYNTEFIRPVIYYAWEVSPQEAEKNREKLATEIEVQVKQVEAWSNLLKKVNEQDIFAGDLDAYVDQEFTRLGKEVMRGWAYAEIFNAPPTREGLTPFGKKEIVALRAWRDVVEEKAYAKIKFKDKDSEDPNKTKDVEGIIPNPFAYSKNQRLLNIALGYVQARVDKECPPEKPINQEDRVMTSANERDNRAAALGGLLLADHFDIDAHSAVQVVQKLNNEGQAERDLVFDLAFVDSAKMLHPRVRRMNEFLGFTEKVWDEKKRRPHPREAGAPISLRFLPNLGSNFLEEVTVDVMATAMEKDKDGKDKIIYDKQKVTLDQISEGAKKKNGERIVYERDGKRYSMVTKAKESGNIQNSDYWEYELKPLSDRSLWDEVSIIKSEGSEKKQLSFDKDNPPRTELMAKADFKEEPHIIDFLQGTNDLPYEVPKGLLERYALTKIYKEFTRTDYVKMMSDYSDPTYLQRLNKGISLGLVLLSTQHQLSKDTHKELEEFVRISLLANVIAATVKDSAGSRSAEQPEQQKQIGLTGMEMDVKLGVLLAAQQARFVLTKSDKYGAVSWERDKDKRLFDDIIRRRNEAPLGPFDFNYFTPEEKNELIPLYR